MGQTFDLKRCLQSETCHEWKVVAVASLIAWADVVATGLHATVGLVVDEQEGGIEDDAFG